MPANPSLRLGECRYDLTHRCLVQGDLSSQGATSDLGRALGRAAALVAGGADILEIGAPAPPGRAGEASEEADEVVALVEALRTRFDLPVAVRTSRAEVLAAACAAGAVVGHDTSGFADPDYLRTAARCGAAVVADGARRAEQVLGAGIAADRIVLDTGVGRATGPERGALLGGTERLAGLGYPLLLSVPDPACFGTPAGSLTAVAYGVAHGCRIVRGPDVAGTVRVVRLVERILEARASGGAAP